MRSSFRDVVDDLYYNQIYSAVDAYVEEKPGRLECYSYVLGTPDAAKLEGMDIIRVNPVESDADSILFDVIVSTEIQIWGKVKHSCQDDDGGEQWFRITCEADIEDGLADFNVIDVNIYNQYQNMQVHKLSEYLVPIISKSQFDDVAEELLQEYYPEGLKQPAPIPIRVIAQRMGLTIKEVRLTKYMNEFGRIYFDSGDAKYYDSDTKEYNQIHVDRGTVLLDPNIFFLRNVGSENNTIAHECVHWYKHKKYHELVKLYDEEAKQINCNVSEITKKKEQWTPEDWMEWQANGIAPRILMPRKTTFQKAQDLIGLYGTMYGLENRADIFESVVTDVAEFFNVSKIAAKIRLLDLGFSEAEGVYTYIDDHYIDSYSFEPESLHKNQTYSISLSDSFFESVANKAFCRYLESGNFVYVDSHFVINDPKYVIRTDAGVQMTSYAKAHADECCLIFDLKPNPNAAMDIVVYLDSVMYRKATPDYNRVPEFDESTHNMEVFNRSEDLKKLHASFMQQGQYAVQCQKPFCQQAMEAIKFVKANKAVFCEKTMLSEKTYERLETNKMPKPTLETVMCICIGLSLGINISNQLLNAAGYELNNTPQQVAYKAFLTSFVGHTLYECDEALKALGLSPLIKNAN